jgi:proline dehydrogenase
MTIFQSCKTNSYLCNITLRSMIETTTPSATVSFDNLKIAFASKSNSDLEKAYWLFKAMGSNFLVNNGPVLLNTALRLKLPVIPLIRPTLFRHFCGGETIEDCHKTITGLYSSGIGSVLDYSVEGEENEANFEITANELLATINRAKGDPAIPFCVFKTTGLGRFECLSKISSGTSITAADRDEFAKIRERVIKICTHASACDVRIFIDAEESWIQPAIDDLADEMMGRFNINGKAIVYNTIQLYRSDRLDFLKSSHLKANTGKYILGLKLVRGAYMEKERDRASKMNYPSPVQPDHQSSNRDYDASLRYCIDNIETISICAGTHNEESCHLLARMMFEKNISHNDDRIWFSQLLGMSDHISYNLAAAGYNVAKYVPYGPVRSVLPYLIRRAQENTSIAGQTGRELRMIREEKNRRRSEKI